MAKPDPAIVWRGPEPLRPLLVPLTSVTPHPDNPRQGDAGAVGASLARFGQQKPIVVQRSTGWIVAGNHTYLGAAMAGELERVLGFGAGEDWTHIAAVMTELPDVEARAYAIADNRTSDLGTYDEDRLARILSELGSRDLLAGTGYDGGDVDALIASLSDADGLSLEERMEAWRGMPDFRTEDVSGYKTVVVHFSDEAGYQAFQKAIGQTFTSKTRSIWYPPVEWDRVRGRVRYAADG